MRRRFVLLALAAVLPLLALTAGLLVFSLRQQRAAMQAEAIHRVEEMLHGVERELFAQVDLLKVLAQSPLLDGDQPDLAGFHRLATRFQGELPLWHRIILADRDGRQLVNTGVAFGTPLPRITDTASHERAVATAAPVIGDVVGPGGLSDGLPRSSFKVPVARDGAVRLVLAATVKMDRLAGLLTPHGLDPAWRPFLVDGAGRLAAAPRAPATVGQRAGDAAIRARDGGSQGVYEGAAATGEPVVTAFHQSDRIGWSAHLAIPLALYNAPLRQAAWMIAAGGVAALALSVAFALVLRRELQGHRADERLRERAARMEALGRMTGGVAHDFNNLLMVILGNLEMMQRRAPRAGLERYVASIRKAAERGTQLTRELLAFSRGDVRETQVVDLNDRVQGVLSMVRQSLRGDIAVELDLAAGPHPVEIDAIQLDLAVLNIAVNARDAMPEGGTLTISTRRALLPDRSGREGVALSITDTGSGIPPEALPHVFEPFFTTKEVGKGTGLGLSQVYGFARASGGTADIASKAGRGTTVTIVLPLTRAAAAAPAASAADAPAASAGSGRTRVLFVDDNADVRTVAADVLRESGFEVREAAHARAALDLLESEGADVLVSDLVMPGGMDGLDLAQEVRRRWPGLPILLVSGYSTSASAATEQGFTLIMKPYQVSELAAAIRARRADPQPARAAPSA
ncbi:MAG TPA: ATP-binding protein [Microvirga sp.]|jgi:signal transduction histidine kinase/ActR/RegA family two-component response regulator|nr:ATP-binding protein [Microvirga sp.]